MQRPLPASKFSAPRDKPLSYPGNRPEVSFVLANNTVFEVHFTKESGDSGNSTINGRVILDEHGSSMNINSFLKKNGVSLLQQRYAVIGYGSNPVPGQLASKFGKDAVVPVILGKLENADIVYNLISNMGYAFAELAINQTSINCGIGITFLDEAQLEKMIETEQNYRLAYAPTNVILESGQSLQSGISSGLYVFAGFRKIWVPKKFEGPVPIAELPSEGRKKAGLSQRQVLELVIDEFELTAAGIKRPEELADRIRNESLWPDEPPKLKFLLQSKVNEEPRSLPSMADQLILVDSTDGLKYILAD